MRMRWYETLPMEKPVTCSLCLSCLNFHGKYFYFKEGIQKLSKLLEISCLPVMKSKLTIIPQFLTCFTHTCQLCVPTIEEVTLKLFFWCGCCSLLIFVAKTVIKGTQLQCLCTHKVPSQVEEQKTIETLPYDRKNFTEYLKRET